MKQAIAALALMVVFAFPALASETDAKKAENIYGFKVESIDGKKVDLKDYKGKVLLIVNTASKCGFTPQYEDMVKLHNEFKEKGFAVLGFPANEFGKQEPGTDEEIKEFCKVNYNVDFPMFSKVVVKGEGQEPLFQYLTHAENKDFKGDIGWNFEKFLIGKDGKLLHRYRSKVVPTGEQIKKDIKAALEE